MKKSFLKVLSAVVFVSISASSFAASSGWVVSAKVIKIVATVNGGINFRLAPELTECISQSGYGPNYASIYPEHPGIKNMHAMLLAAYLSDKPVGVYFGDAKCTVGEIELGGRY
jgi:hypothetical protein